MLEKNRVPGYNAETARANGSGTGPNGALVVDLDAVSPAPGGVDQPLSTGGRTGQWILIPFPF